MPRKKSSRSVASQPSESVATQVVAAIDPVLHATAVYQSRDEGSRVIIALMAIVIFCLTIIVGFLFYRELFGSITFGRGEQSEQSSFQVSQSGLQ